MSAPRPIADAAPCPCDTGRAYAACCGRLHAGRVAPTASALMRSRYSAFVLGLEDYLLETWHPATRPDALGLDAETTWTGLVVEATAGGRAWDAEGTVRFAASHDGPEGPGVLRETSRFVLVDGRWLYVDGVHA